ncbi:hypothetical protein [Rarobacter incanus]|nr:hypothetical protein [Rarobacter incanus]
MTALAIAALLAASTLGASAPAQAAESVVAAASATTAASNATGATPTLAAPKAVTITSTFRTSLAGISKPKNALKLLTTFAQVKVKGVTQPIVIGVKEGPRSAAQAWKLKKNQRVNVKLKGKKTQKLRVIKVLNKSTVASYKPTFAEQSRTKLIIGVSSVTKPGKMKLILVGK